MEQLKITGITKIPDYNGEPCSVVIELIDKADGVYETEIQFDDGFDKHKFKDAMVIVMKSTDKPVKEVHIKRFKIKN